jgi:hypothetical protein
MLMPFVPALRIEAKTSWQSMVIDLVMGHGAEAAGIEAVDLAVEGGLGDGAGESLARCGAAARIGIIAYPGHPGPECLGMNGRGLQQQREQRCSERMWQGDPTHGVLQVNESANFRWNNGVYAVCL